MANCGWSKRWEDYTEPCTDERTYTFILNKCPFKNIICFDSFQQHELVAHHVPSTLMISGNTDIIRIQCNFSEETDT